MQQRLQLVVDRVDQADLLLDEPRVQLRVPGLVHGLGGGVELGVQVRDGLHDPGRADHGALLAVQELGELPGRVVPPQFPDVVGAQLVPVLGAVDRHGLVRQAQHVVRVDLQAPVDPLDRVPLLVLALGVQVEQPLPGLVVLPGEPGVAGHLHRPAGLIGLGGVQVTGGHAWPPACAVAASPRDKHVRCTYVNDGRVTAAREWPPNGGPAMPVAATGLSACGDRPAGPAPAGDPWLAACSGLRSSPP